MKHILLTSFSTLIAVTLLAQAPEAFNYQGVTRDLSGNPIPSQNISLRIAILQGSTTGTEVYKEIHSTITTPLGLFNLQIGKGIVTDGDFSTIEWGNGPHFIQIELDENGGSNYQLIGTSQLLSVPYAMYAKRSGESQWNNNLEGIDYMDGNVGIGTSNPQVKLEINMPGGTDSTALVISENTSLNDSGFTIFSGFSALGNTNYLSFGPYGYGSNLTFLNPGKALVISADRNIGINTIVPKARLQVTGGDVYIEDINKGIIMKSPNGQCWRVTIANSGQLVPTTIVCPN